MQCGYCLLSKEDTGSELTFDHFQPQSAGGSDEADNLVQACNEFKGECWGDTEETRLLHPLRDEINLHIREETDRTLIGITPPGQRYISQLQLNRFPLVLHRKSQLRDAQTARRLDAIEARVDQILARIRLLPCKRP